MKATETRKTDALDVATQAGVCMCTGTYSVADFDFPAVGTRGCRVWSEASSEHRHLMGSALQITAWIPGSSLYEGERHRNYFRRRGYLLNDNRKVQMATVFRLLRCTLRVRVGSMTTDCTDAARSMTFGVAPRAAKNWGWHRSRWAISGIMHCGNPPSVGAPASRSPSPSTSSPGKPAGPERRPRDRERDSASGMVRCTMVAGETWIGFRDLTLLC